MADDDYVCTLYEASLRVAQEELKEEPKERLSQVETFRQWINQQKHLTVPTDTEHLLKYLRVAKFSQLEARSVLEEHFKVKSKYKDWLCDVDFSAPDLRRFLEARICIPFPKRDQFGRKVLLYRYDNLEPDHKKWSRDTMIKLFFGVIRYCLMDENVQVNGIVFFCDFSNTSMKLMTYFGLDGTRKSMQIWQGKYPGRFKSVYMYNNGAVIDALMGMMRPVLKPKFKERMHVLGRSLEHLYKVIPMEYLPLDYLPDEYQGPSQGHLDDIQRDFLADVSRPEVIAKVLHETSSKYMYDFKLKPEEAAPRESFRKLNID